MALHDHTGVIWERNLQREAGFSRRRFRFAGAARASRIAIARRGRAFSPSPTPSIHSIRTYGFEHPEETAWRKGATEIVFNSETYGDADIIEIDASGLPDAQISVEGTIGEYQKIGDPRAHSAFVHRPTFKWDVTGAELFEKGELRRDLGGEGLFLALERLTDAPLPLEISGEIEVEARTARTASARFTSRRGRSATRRSGRRRCSSAFELNERTIGRRPKAAASVKLSLGQERTSRASP